MPLSFCSKSRACAASELIFFVEREAEASGIVCSRGRLVANNCAVSQERLSREVAERACTVGYSIAATATGRLELS